MGRIVMLCAVLFGLLAACVAQQPERDYDYFVGESQAIGNGVVYSWLRVNAKNQPIAIGFNFSDTALINLPDLNTQYQLSLPDIVPHAPFNHLALDWLPRGHIPAHIYDVPHFDFHFYTVPPQVRAHMTLGAEGAARMMRKPAAQYLPEGYQPAPPAIALMGLHWVSPTFPEFYNQPFTESLLYGSYNGNVAFIEPMMTRTFLLTNPQVDKAVPQPRAVQVSGYYPTRYLISYDATRHLYTVALMGMTYRTAR